MTKIHPVARFINNSKGFRRFLTNVNDNPGLWGSAIATAGATMIFRPATVACMTMPADDKKYTIASSVAAGVTDLAATALVFNGLTKSIQKASDNLFKAEGTVYHNNPEILRRYKSLSNRAFKLALLFPISMLRFSLVKPIVDIMFKKKKEEGKCA